MKAPLSLLTALVLVVPGGASLAAQTTTVISDSFDSYSPGLLPTTAAWPSPIPGMTPPAYWRTSSSSGPQSIIAGSVAGRSGQLLSISEVAAGQTSGYSSTAVSGAVLEGASWTLSLDFYIADFHNTPTALQLPSFFSIAGLFDESVTAANRFLAVTASRNSSTGRIQTSISIDGSSSFFSGNLEEQTWYTLTITGNNESETVTATLSGAGYTATLNGLGYTFPGFDILAIGDSTANAWAAGRSNVVYFDNMSLTMQAIPEPGTFVLLAAGGVLATFLRRKRRRSGNLNLLPL